MRSYRCTGHYSTGINHRGVGLDGPAGPSRAHPGRSLRRADRGVGLDGPAGPSLARLNRLDRIDRADRAGAPPLVLGRAAGDGQTLPVSGFVVRYPVTTAPRRSRPQGQPRFSELSRGSADGCQTQHLEFIQSVINRMGANSFRLKDWAVVLVSVLMILV